jgi:ribonuclease HII
MLTPPRTVVRREAGLYALERAIQRRGFHYVAGADEAGRGACAGPLVAAAAILPQGRRGEIDGLADSKLLTPAVREQIYQEVVERAAGYAVVVVPADEVDGRGLHVCNVAAMRRALATLSVRPDYVLTDGFGVDGLGVPGLGVWKGDQVAACVAAASVLAKVTRDRLMVELDGRFPDYGFAEHKGYITPEHTAALHRHGPCVEHRFSYINVATASGRDAHPARRRRPLLADREMDLLSGGEPDLPPGGEPDLLAGADPAGVGGTAGNRQRGEVPAGSTVSLTLSGGHRRSTPVRKNGAMEGGER